MKILHIGETCEGTFQTLFIISSRGNHKRPLTDLQIRQGVFPKTSRHFLKTS
jgi:hypothetical protein